MCNIVEHNRKISFLNENNKPIKTTKNDVTLFPKRKQRLRKDKKKL